MARKIHWSITRICRRTSFTFILELQPVSILIRPSVASSLHSAPCLGFPVVNYTSLKVFFQNFPPACTSWGFLTVVLQGKGGSLTSNQKLVDQASIFMSPGDREVHLYPRTLGIHFNRILQRKEYTGDLLLPGHHREEETLLLLLLLYFFFFFFLLHYGTKPDNRPWPYGYDLFTPVHPQFLFSNFLYPVSSWNHPLLPQSIFF